MNFNQTYRDDKSMSRATLGLHKAKSSQSSAHRAVDTVLELAELVRDLHQSLESYAPMWYTKEMDDRVRETLAGADSAFQASADRP